VGTKGKTLEEIDEIFEGSKRSDVPDVAEVQAGRVTGLVQQLQHADEVEAVVASASVYEKRFFNQEDEMKPARFERIPRTLLATMSFSDRYFGCYSLTCQIRCLAGHQSFW